MHRIALGLLLIATSAARADVVDATTDGFTVKQTVTVAAPRAKAWTAFVDIGAWWSKDHT